MIWVTTYILAGLAFAFWTRPTWDPIDDWWQALPFMIAIGGIMWVGILGVLIWDGVTAGVWRLRR